MRLILEDKAEVYERLEKPSPDPRNLAIAQAMSQVSGESYRSQQTIETIENRIQTGIRGLSASLPSPLNDATILFARNGNYYFGAIRISFEPEASFSHFSDFLRQRFNGNGKYLWIPTKDFGFGYFNNSSLRDLNPVASVDGVNSKNGSVRTIWIGTSGAAARTFDRESFEFGFEELGTLAEGYINAYLDYCSKGIRPSGRIGFLSGKRKHNNPSDLIVKLFVI